LWLILALFGVAVTFVLLSATFLAVVQVVVYIGAIAVLMVFAVMLTRKVMSDTGPQLNKNVGLAALLGLALFAGLTAIIFQSGAAGAPLPELGARADTVSDLGVALVSPQGYILPFELASVLLLAALIGAIVVAWKK
jgi:NADH-quinone oxidoreductase subunit J